MDSELIPCGLPTVTSPPKGQASEYDKKYFLALRFPVACHRESSIEVENEGIMERQYKFCAP
jgi:hypothetical protein